MLIRELRPMSLLVPERKNPKIRPSHRSGGVRELVNGGFIVHDGKPYKGVISVRASCETLLVSLRDFGLRIFFKPSSHRPKGSSARMTLRSSLIFTAFMVFALSAAELDMWTLEPRLIMTTTQCPFWETSESVCISFRFQIKYNRCCTVRA
jgi:hypothetical protein